MDGTRPAKAGVSGQREEIAIGGSGDLWRRSNQGNGLAICRLVLSPDRSTGHLPQREATSSGIRVIEGRVATCWPVSSPDQPAGHLCRGRPPAG